MIRKLIIILSLFILASCTFKEPHTIPNEKTRPFNQLVCNYLEDNYYYCNKEYDANGEYIIYRNGEIVSKILLENGTYLYHDESCAECIYLPSVFIGTIWELDGNQVYSFGHDQYYTMIYNKYTGEVIHTLEGFLAQLTVNGIPNTKWITSFDPISYKFRLLDRNTFTQYQDYYLDLEAVPALNLSYQLGNGTYFTAFQVIDDHTLYFVLDYDGNIVYGPTEDKLELGFSTNYIEIINNKKYGLITLDGTQVLPLEYDAIEANRNGITAIKDDRLYIYSVSLQPLISGEYKVAPREYLSYLCCDNYNNFTAYDDGDSLIVTTIDTDHMYSRNSIPLNPKYTHKFQVDGESIIELEYDYRY